MPFEILYFYHIFLRIMILDEGRVVEFGATEALMRDESSKLHEVAREAGLTWDHLDDADDERLSEKKSK